MGKVLPFHARARAEAQDACASPGEGGGKRGELVIFPGADFSRVLRSLAAHDPDGAAAPRKDCPG
jgi:hypothetical protein